VKALQQNQRRALILCAVLALLGPLRGWAQNRVLQLSGGTNSYVELPPGIFADLTEATVEGWMKWEGLGPWTSFFDFGNTWNSMNVTQLTGGHEPNLVFELQVPPRHGPNKRTGYVIVIRDILRTNEWCHIAAVTGQDGMKLYFDGELIGKDPVKASFANMVDHTRNFLGRNNSFDAGPNDVSDLLGKWTKSASGKLPALANRFATRCSSDSQAKENDLVAVELR
jgi:hypothetical protein